MNKQTNLLRFVMAIFLLIGILFSGISIYLFKTHQDFMKSVIQTEGRVINLRTGGKGGRAPVVEFIDKEGKTHFYYHDVYSKPSSYSLDEQVQIFYNPSYPDNAHLEGDYFLILIFGFIGGVFTFISIICIKVFWKPY